MHHGLLERYLLDVDAMAQQGHQRDPRVNVGGLHEWRLGEIRVVGDRDSAEIRDYTPSEARVDVLDVDLAADRVARLGQNEAALLLDDPVEVEHGINHHRDHDHNDRTNHDDGRPDELAHHDTPSRSDEISFSTEAGGYDNAAALDRRDDLGALYRFFQATRPRGTLASIARDARGGNNR